MQISRKRFEIEAKYQLPTDRKLPMADQMMTSSMTSVTLKGQGRDPNIFNACYLKNGSRLRLGYKGAAIGISKFGTEWSRDR